MKRTIDALLRLGVTVIGALWCQVQQSQSQDHVFANPPVLSSRDGRLDVELVAAPGTYTIGGHQFQGIALQRRIRAASVACPLGRFSSRYPS